MISLLNGTQAHRQRDIRNLYRQRVLDLADSNRPGTTPESPDDGEAEAAEQRVTEGAAAHVGLGEDTPAGCPDESGPDQFRLLAERLAPKYIDTLAEAMQEMLNLAFRERDRNEDVVERLIALSDETRHISAEISTLCDAAERLSGAQQGLTNKTAMLEGKLAACVANDRKLIDDLQTLATAQARDHESHGMVKAAAEERIGHVERRLAERLEALDKRAVATAECISATSGDVERMLQTLERQAEANASMTESLSRVEEAQQVLQRRLDAQADALRTVQASEEGRSRQVQAALQSILKEATLGSSILLPLPEGL